MAICRHFKSNLILSLKHGPLRVCRLMSVLSDDTDLKNVLATKLPQIQKSVKDFREQYGSRVIDEITVDMVYGGMRNMVALVSETSESDRDVGVRFRGHTIPECHRLLPKSEGSEQPLPESLFWLIVTGDIPTEQQVKALSRTWTNRAELPSHVVEMLNNFPSHLHPMSQFSAAVTALNSESSFQKAYARGLHKSKYWEYVYEDAMDLLGKLPTVAAIIYNNLYRDRTAIEKMDENRDWAHNYMTMMGYDNRQFVDYMRLYLFSHSDHEAGNVSAHTGHLVGSALSDPYLAFAAALNGLAGPLHGLAIQEVLVWLRNLQSELGKDISSENLKKFVWKTLNSGQVVPGYGHAVLRKTDPRYLCVREFAQKNLPHDPLFQLVSRLFDIVPPILMETGKVKNPWPNADAHTGVILQYFGMKEMSYYTVIFGVSRSLGVMANLILDRILGLPIERPKSVSTECLRKLVGYSMKEKLRQHNI